MLWEAFRIAVLGCLLMQGECCVDGCTPAEAARQVKTLLHESFESAQIGSEWIFPLLTEPFHLTYDRVEGGIQ
jgi:hypothetical protein